MLNSLVVPHSELLDFKRQAHLFGGTTHDGTVVIGVYACSNSQNVEDTISITVINTPYHTEVVQQLTPWKET